MCVFLCSLRMNQEVHFFFWGGVSAFLGIIQCSSVSFPDLVLVTFFSSCLVVLLSFFADPGATCSPLDHNAGEARRRDRVCFPGVFQ